MPVGPKGQKRPADVIGAAVKIARIATGEEPDDIPADDGKDKAAQALDRVPMERTMKTTVAGPADSLIAGGALPNEKGRRR